MSKAPTTKQSFITNILLMLVIFLGLQLFLGKNQSPPDHRTYSDVLAKMREQNQGVLDKDILNEDRALDSKIGDAEKAKEITAEQATKLRLEGQVLVADTQLKGGILKDEIARLESAYQTIESARKRYSENADWTSERVAVADVSTDPKYGWSSWTPESLYSTVVAKLSAANKKDLVGGFIPGFQVIDFLVHATGAISAFSYWLAALFLAVLVRAIIWPLSQRQIMWGRQMQQMTPLMEPIKKEFKDNPTEMNKRIMDLYKEYGINPAAGCIPMFIQLPFFLTIYRCMLHYRFEFQKGTFLWINGAMSRATHGFVAPNLGQQDTILIAIYGITMIASTLVAPVTDPNNLKQQRLMGLAMSVLFTGMMFFGFFPVPAGFVLYWTFTNILATGQSLRAYRLPLPPLVKTNSPTGGLFPLSANLSPSGALNGEVRTGKPTKHKRKKR